MIVEIKTQVMLSAQLTISCQLARSIVSPPATVLVFGHSFKGYAQYQPVLAGALEKLTTPELAVCTFDFRGSGQSEGRYEETSVMTQVEDLTAVVNHLKGLGYSQFILGGVSLGAVVALLAPVERVLGYLFWSPCLAMDHLYERYSRRFPPDQARLGGFVEVKRGGDGKTVRVGWDMVNSFSQTPSYNDLLTTPKPVLSIFGSREHITDLTRAREAHNQPGLQAEMQVVDDADHDFRSPPGATEAVWEMSALWLAKLLAQDGAAVLTAERINCAGL